MTTPSPQAAEPAWIARRSCAPRRRRALLADTDEPTLTIVGHRLSRAGFSVRTERTGPDALDAVLEAAPDVVVAASRLPGLDGLRLFERLRDEMEAPPPVVLVFWPGNAAAVATALDAGVADVIVRPLSLVEAVSRIRRFVPV
ncbi:response regulator [Rubrivirga marina]|uniref:Response regulatory domain-containing protein n=1 Tax=Rubrivirga marina TaxID=1196024 RepID=A0A271IYF2_9BACT|nr:response regulator [Rubrivirga marina]PAP76160.1 hypothetical protein BSZ37_06720 [Rubrivirga marina]